MKEEELRCILKLEKENSELVKKVKIGVKRLLNQNDQKDKEIERLNNIINSLEQEMNEELKIETSGEDFWCGYDECIKDILNKLKKLKQEN